MFTKEQEDMIARSLFTESKKLRVFDFDDTLVKTTSFIYIINNGKKTKLTPGEYAVYNEKPGDEFDFSDFQKVQDPNEIKKIQTYKSKNKDNELGKFTLHLQIDDNRLSFDLIIDFTFSATSLIGTPSYLLMPLSVYCS